MRFSYLQAAIILCVFTKSIIAQSIAGNSTASQLRKYQTNVVLSINKTEFLKYETICLYADIVNYDSLGPYLPHEMGTELYLTEKSGEGFFLNPSIAHLGPAKIPIGTIHTMGDLVHGHGIEDENYTRYLPAGSYELVYRHQSQGYEPIISNKLFFSIVEPADNEIEALSLFLKARKYYYEREPDMAYAVFDSFLTQYPQSAFLDRVLLDFIELEQKNNKETADEHILWMLRSCYESSYYRTACLMYLHPFRKIDEESTGKQKLKKIVNQIPNEKMKKVIHEFVLNPKERFGE